MIKSLSFEFQRLSSSRPMMTLAFFSLLAMLSIENVSLVVPVTALSYAAGTTGAMLFLHERISPQRWLGVLIVCVGVTLVWLSRR